MNEKIVSVNHAEHEKSLNFNFLVFHFSFALPDSRYTELRIDCVQLEIPIETERELWKGECDAREFPTRLVRRWKHRRKGKSEIDAKHKKVSREKRTNLMTRCTFHHSSRKTRTRASARDIKAVKKSRIDR